MHFYASDGQKMPVTACLYDAAKNQKTLISVESSIYSGVSAVSDQDSVRCFM